MVSISESGPDHVRVSWGPLQPHRVRQYQVEYAVLPSGTVRTVKLHSHENSTLLTQLRSATQYLVTVTALHRSGQERAMSVKACTQEGKKVSSNLRISVLLPDLYISRQMDERDR